MLVPGCRTEEAGAILTDFQLLHCSHFTFDQMTTGIFSRNVGKVIFRAEVLSTYDVSQVIILPGLPFPFNFSFMHVGRAWERGYSELQELLNQ